MKFAFRIAEILILGALGAASCSLIIPMFYGVFHWGMLFLPVFAAAFLAVLNPKPVQMAKRRYKTMYKIAVGALIVSAIVFASISVLMLNAAHGPVYGKTVVVLGCKVNGDEPSPMLVRRMDTAIAYLDKNPICSVIVTGGIGAGESTREAAVMHRYLAEHGIDEKRIFVEDRAVNTEQNMRYSARIIADNNLDNNIIVASDNSHQYRASIFAKKYGLAASPLGSPANIILAFGYWCREVIGVLRAWILGY
ncbi:MAG: YdcF family protein [Oscillospiraceae bacterium]